ncbi:MAG: TIGR02449 family protein [Gammaproteobacteria bacterium]
MNDNNDNNKEQMDLVTLELKVDQLIQTVEDLSEENEALRQQQGALAVERADLIEKTELARTRVEAMISRLKSMETRT